MSDKGIINDSLLDQFTCPVCFEYLDKKIYICTNGHSICGVCKAKLPKCPVCKVKLNSQRNISLEQAAKKVKEYKAKQEALLATEKYVATLPLPLKRRQRLSLGSQIFDHRDAAIVPESQIQCPHTKCCFFTEHLLQLKIHLQCWHRDQMYEIKKEPNIKSEDLMRIRLYWDVYSVYNMYVVTISDALFIVFIVRTPNYIKNSSHYVNVLTVSNKTKMYKFSCGTAIRFSMFFQGRHQAQDGIVVDNGTLETLTKNGGSKYFVKILITRVASLHRDD